MKEMPELITGMLLHTTQSRWYLVADAANKLTYRLKLNANDELVLQGFTQDLGEGFTALDNINQVFWSATPGSPELSTCQLKNLIRRKGKVSGKTIKSWRRREPRKVVTRKQLEQIFGCKIKIV